MLVVELNFKDPFKVNPFILQWRSKHKKDVMDNGSRDLTSAVGQPATPCVYPGGWRKWLVGNINNLAYFCAHLGPLSLWRSRCGNEDLEIVKCEKRSASKKAVKNVKNFPNNLHTFRRVGKTLQHARFLPCTLRQNLKIYCISHSL